MTTIDEFVAALTWAKIIPDASYIWWALRPSLGNPTVELRVADSCTRLDDAVAIAALFRCLVRALDRDRALNAGFDRVGRAITVENKWHAQRYGIAATFVDPFSRSPLTLKQWLDQVFDFIAEDIDALGCAADIRRLHRITVDGTSADRQIDLFTKAKAAGRRRLTAIKDVIDWAARETQAVRRLKRLKAERRPGFPFPPGPPIKCRSFTRIDRNVAPAAGKPCRRPSTSSTARI